MASSSQRSVPENSGVYIISNRCNRLYYIGSTFNFKDRFGKHLSKLVRKKHPNKKLQTLFNREQVLFFKPAKVCGLLELTRYEQEYLNRYMNKLLNVVMKVRHYRRQKGAS